MEKKSLVLICTTIVVCTAIIATVLMLLNANSDELPEGWLPLFFAFVGTSIASVASLSKINKVERVVNDLNNGRADAKMRAAVADVVADEYLDPTQAAQTERDRERRDGHS